jgi:hypothetical protein
VRLNTAAQTPGEPEVLTVSDIYSAGGSPMLVAEEYEFLAGITPISTVQAPVSAENDSSQYEGMQVTVSGVVTSSSSTFGGPYFMQDQSGPWSGLYVYDPSANRTLGDSIRVTGVIQEYYNWTELVSVDLTLVDGTGAATQATPVSDFGQVADPDSAEKYESQLISLDSLEVLTYLDDFDEWTIGEGTDTLKIGDFACGSTGPCYTYPGLGSFIDITGLLRYNYGEFKLEPRSDSDITIVVPCTAGVRDESGLTLKLSSAAPNPFNTGTEIRFTIPSKSRARLAVYDVSGRLVKVISDGVWEAGDHSLSWNGRDTHGARISSGVYFCRLTTPGRSLEQKMIVVR